MSNYFSFFAYLPESIAILMVGFMVITMIGISSSWLAMNKVRSSQERTLWQATSLPSIALRKAHIVVRNLFIAYAIIFPFYRELPNLWTVIACLGVVLTLSLYACIRFKYAQYVETIPRKELTEKQKQNHIKYVSSEERQFNAIVKCIDLIDLKKP